MKQSENNQRTSATVFFRTFGALPEVHFLHTIYHFLHTIPTLFREVFQFSQVFLHCLVSNMAYTTSNKRNKNKETKENKTTKRLILTKTKLKDRLKYEQVKETIKKR